MSFGIPCQQSTAHRKGNVRLLVRADGVLVNPHGNGGYAVVCALQGAETQHLFLTVVDRVQNPLHVALCIGRNSTDVSGILPILQYIGDFHQYTACSQAGNGFARGILHLDGDNGACADDCCRTPFQCGVVQFLYHHAGVSLCLSADGTHGLNIQSYFYAGFRRAENGVGNLPVQHSLLEVGGKISGFQGGFLGVSL